MNSEAHHDPPVSDEANEASEIEVQPTYAPAAMALGVMMLLWGVVTMWIMSVAGACLIAWSLDSWIRDIREAPFLDEDRH